MKIKFMFPNVGSDKSDLTVRSNNSECLFFKIEDKEVAIEKVDFLKIIKLFDEECK